MKIKKPKPSPSSPSELSAESDPGKNELAYDGRFASLTWKDLESFAGKKSVSRGKGYVAEVSKIRQDDSGAVIASVQGGQEYATKVWFGDDGKLNSYCTCPVGFDCKHAVALALKVIDEIKKGKKPMPLDADDERLEELSLYNEDYDEEEDEYDEEEDNGDFEEETRVTAPNPAKSKPGNDPVNDYIDSLSADGCRELLREIADGFGAVRTELQRRITLAKSDVGTLAAKAKAAIRDATAYACRFYHWGDRDRSIYPDYSEARRFLERLLELKAYDKLIALSDYLSQRAVNQMLMSEHDEGQIGNEAEECMEVIAKAVARSAMPDVDKILWFRKLHDGDEYCFYEQIKGVWDSPKAVAKSAWSKVADVLARELSSQGNVGSDISFSGMKLSGMVEDALRFAGREGEVVEFRKKTVAKTGDYESLVKELIAGERFKEARDWCLRGLKKDFARHAQPLRELMIDIAGRLGDKAETCAYIADCFFDAPSLDKYKKLAAAARHARVHDAVRRDVLRFLETGVLPWDEKKNLWPLPLTGSTKVSRYETFPLYDLLVEIALDEGRLEDAVGFYKADRGGAKRNAWYWQRGADGDQGWMVAEKVSEKLPEEAIAIWRGLIASNRGKVGNGYYYLIGEALRQMRPVMERLGKLEEWKGQIADLRQTQKSKRNLMKVLDEVEFGRPPDSPIISSPRA